VNAFAGERDGVQREDGKIHPEDATGALARRPGTIRS
jgi:hypothetical protein